MTNVAFPVVLQALVTLATTALNPVRVVGGFDLSQDPSDVVTIGVPDFNNTQALSMGQFTQTAMGFGASAPLEENGSITGEVLAWNGDGDQILALTTACGYFATLNAAVRAAPALGITAFSVTGEMSTTGEPISNPGDGATVYIPFTFGYKAVI